MFAATFINETHYHISLIVVEQIRTVQHFQFLLGMIQVSEIIII